MKSKMQDTIVPPRKLFLAALAASLGGCGISSLFIDLDTKNEDGAIWFEDPRQGWLTSHCVRHVTVTELRLHEILDESDPVVWEANGVGAQCLTSIPFQYGFIENPPDRNRSYIEAKPLEPGTSYEIFVELSNGAGSGTFSLNADGTITNND